MGASRTLAASLCAALAGCVGDVSGDTAAPEVEGATFACEIGFEDEDGAWVSAEEGDNAELVLGFQGFLFIEFKVLAEADSPSPVLVRMSMEVEGDAPFDGSQPDVAMVAQDSGERVSEVINLFLPTNDVGGYLDRQALVVMRLEDEASDLSCTASRTVTLVDEDPCIHTGGEPVCPEDDTGVTR